MAAIKIGIMGDFNARHHTHVAINDALGHTAVVLGVDIETVWLPTPALADAQPVGFDALWAAPASPYKSMDGMLRGIEYARTHNVPFTGT